MMLWQGTKTWLWRKDYATKNIEMAVCLFNIAESTQLALDILARAVGKLGMCLVSSALCSGVGILQATSHLERHPSRCGRSFYLH